MPYPSSVEEAIVARLKANAGLQSLTGGRISTQLTTQDAPLPAITVQRVGADTPPNLAGGSDSGKLKRYTVQVDTYAESEAALHAPAAAVVSVLHAQPDATLGISGAFHNDSQGAADETGRRVMTHTFAVWFRLP